MDEIAEITELEKQYREEWLLIEVLETDAVDRPIKGKLLSHSKSREEIHQAAMKKRDLGADYLISYTGDPIPPDMVVVL